MKGQQAKVDFRKRLIELTDPTRMDQKRDHNKRDETTGATKDLL